MCAVDLRVVYVIVVIINIVENKRYDIHQQCKEEYGLDLDGVLRQFRRSDDYLQILKWTTQEFHDFYMDVIIETLDFNIEQLRKIIEADMGIVESTSSTTTTTTTTETPAADTEAKVGQKASARRQDNPGGVMTHDSVKNMVKVKRLDNYSKLNSYLTVEERNNYKDLGYTYAGEAIHTVIMGFGGNPVEEEVRSTRLFQQSSSYRSTQHPSKHVATRQLKSQSKQMEGADISIEDGERKGKLRQKKGHTRFALVARGFGLNS